MTPTPRPLAAALSRRSFLAGAGAAGVLLASGCASSGGTVAASSTSNPDALNLVARFSQNEYALAGIPQRLVVSVLSNRGQQPTDLPASVEFQVTRDGAAVGPAVAAAPHDDGVPVAYFPVRTTIAEPGTYALEATIRDQALALPFVVADAASSRLVQPGQPVPAVDTPTTTAARGVDPICTRQPSPCPFHDLDLTTALGASAPTALLVSTPQFCQIGVCGPVLELLTEAVPAHPGLQVVHAEVYAGPEGPAGPTSPTVEALGLSFEPSLLLIGADGVVTERLDLVFDRTEIAEALGTLTS